MIRSTLMVAVFAILSAAVLVSAAVPGDPALDGTRDMIDADALAQADPASAPAFRELDARLAAAHTRIGQRTEAARDLAHGNLTMDEAAARFRELNAAQPVALTVLAAQFPGAGEDELVCRQVIGFVRALRRTDPAAVRALPALEAEVNRRFRRLGCPRVPVGDSPGG